MFCGWVVAWARVWARAGAADRHLGDAPSSADTNDPLSLVVSIPIEDSPS